MKLCVVCEKVEACEKNVFSVRKLYGVGERKTDIPGRSIPRVLQQNGQARTTDLAQVCIGCE